MAAKAKAKKKRGAKKAKSRTKPARRVVARKSAKKKKAAIRAPKRKTAAARPAKKPAVKLVRARPKKPVGPPPSPTDAVEVSGIYERVMYSENDPLQEVKEIFGHYDRDKSGVIETSEFARICEALGMEMEDDELQAGISVVDSDNDGRISWDEFLGWWRSLGR